MHTQLKWVLCLAVAAAASACTSVGPGSVQRDRFDYANALTDSWREQMLLNIVKLRYFDAPVFLDVSSVISSYTLQSQINIEGQWYPFSTSTGSNNTNRTLGASGIYTDRPTITYTPVTGEKYVEKLLRPIPPQAIFAMLQAGHAADYILPLTVRAINDVYNYSATPARRRREDPAFYKVIDAFRRVQLAGAFGVRVEKRGNAEITLVSFRDNVEPELEQDIHLIKDTLGIRRDIKELILMYGSGRHDENELVLLTRSIWEILAELSAGVEVPERDRAEGRATAGPSAGARPRAMPIAHIHSSSVSPSDAFAAVRYRNHWFWIDDRDLDSKRVFTFLTVFSSIAEKGTVPQVPIITIPAN